MDIFIILLSFIILPLCIILFMSSVEDLVDRFPSNSNQDRIITALEEQIERLNVQIESLETSREILMEQMKLESKEHKITIDAKDYDGLITPMFSDEGNIIAIALEDENIDKYFIEGVDMDNNIIEPFMVSYDNEWYFILPDSDVIFYIKQK